MSPVVRPVFTVATMEEKTIVSAEIQECGLFEKPCFYTGAGRLKGSYIRVGDADIPMTEYEVYSYEAFRKRVHDELRVINDITKEYLDFNFLVDYTAKLKIKKPNLANVSLEKIYQLQGFIRDNMPTLAGIMLFGVYPQAVFPQLCIIAVAVPGTEIGEIGLDKERFIDNKRIEGTLFQMLEQALSFVKLIVS